MKKNAEESKQKRPTAADVARLAGVSRTQVSYVMGNYRLEHVSEDNIRRINEAAQTLGYQPHSSAQTLRRGFSKEFSIFFPAPYPARINEMIGSIHEQGLENGFAPIQYSFHSYRNRDRLQDAMNTMLNNKPYGVFCSLLDLTEDDLSYMLACGVKKLLILDVEMHGRYPTLYIPSAEVGAIAADYLIIQGYRNIAFLRPSDPVQSHPCKLRLDSFEKRLEEDPEVNLQVLDWPKDSFRPDATSARAFARTLLSLSKPPSAIYTYGDEYALFLMEALKEQGVEIPGDIAVLGTDDSKWGNLVSPKLSTIRMDSEDVGKIAVRMMNALITGNEDPSHIAIGPRPTIIQRESC